MSVEKKYGLTEGILEGLRPDNGRVHTVRIQHYNDDHSWHHPADQQVWVGGSPEGNPFLGAYVNKNEFLEMIAKVFDVHIETWDSYYGRED